MGREDRGPAGATNLRCSVDSTSRQAPFRRHLRRLDMGKRRRSAVIQGRPIDFCFHEFRLDYEQTKHLAVGKPVYSDPFSAGGHMWRMGYSFGHEDLNSDNGERLYVFIKLVSQPRPSSVNAICEVFWMNKDGRPSSTAQQRTGATFELEDQRSSWFVTRIDRVQNHVTDGNIRIICGIMVVNDHSIPVPPSNMVDHLGTLLDTADGADVSFIVGNETFHAHRALLAARSPVFRAELLGSMAEATMAYITLHDIAPAIFKLMLRFMYTDTFPGDAELGDCPSEMIRHLLAVADRYTLDRLKLSCAWKLWDIVSVDTVGATLAWAEMYNCSELKIKCIDFFAMEKNFRKAVLTDGFVQLVQQFPYIVAELRERPVAVYSAGMQGHPIDFCFHEFRLDYEQTKHLAVGKAVYSDPFSAGGHMWKIKFFPCGNLTDNDEHLSLFVQLENQPRPRSISAIIEVFLMDKDGQPSSTAQRRTRVDLSQMEALGWSRFVTRTDLVENHVKDGHMKIICGIMVNDSSIPVPPSDIAEHLGTLLDSTDGADVSFVVGNKTFHTHRALLAARSPVFRAELLGSMVEATAASITLHDIAPATFKLMLRFMYTDAFPGDAELGECPSEMICHLLAAADRYALDRLKLSCAQKLWDIVSVDTVAATLACAEMYYCPELKIKCIDFFAMEKNFRKAVLTDGFVQLVQQFPSIIAELKERPVA